MPDAKVRAQLFELLRDYVARDLVPDAVARAEAKNLVRSARARRNVRKLVAALGEPGVRQAADEQALAAARACLQKFAGKMDVPALSGEAKEKKGGFVRDMVRGMQKDGDAPRLFLTLVVVLWAGRAEGVVYATGKFAPKVVKLLKAERGLDVEKVKRLEELKDLVKAGGVGDAEKEEMRKMAAEAWEG